MDLGCVVDIHIGHDIDKRVIGNILPNVSENPGTFSRGPAKKSVRNNNVHLRVVWELAEYQFNMNRIPRLWCFSEPIGYAPGYLLIRRVRAVRHGREAETAEWACLFVLQDT
jgi:hypothetical protein